MKSRDDHYKELEDIYQTRNDGQFKKYIASLLIEILWTLQKSSEEKTSQKSKKCGGNSRQKTAGKPIK